jgi:hypothetical protein
MEWQYIELQTRWGDGNRAPNLDDLKAAIEELKTEDLEHPCAFISDEFGNVLEAYQDKKVLYYNLDEANKMKSLTVESFDELLSIWLLMCEGKTDDLNRIFK